MSYAAAILLAVVGIAMILARRRLAQMQAMIVGGRTGAGCVVAEAVVLLAIAALILALR